MHFAMTHQFPFAANRTDQCRVFVNANHTFALFELRLQRKGKWFEHQWNGIEMREDKLHRYDPKAFIRSSQPKTWDTLGKDHGARRTTSIDCAIAPRFLHRRPGP